jgi:hypothetical protein
LVYTNSMGISARRGQSLVELLIAIGIGIIFVVGAIGALSVTLRLESQSNHGQPATELTAELTEQIRTITNDDWHTISTLTRNDPAAKYKTVSGTFYSVESGYAEFPSDTLTYRRYFLVEDAFRDTQGRLAASGIADPSSLKVTAVTEWDEFGQTVDARTVFYVARTRNRIWQPTDWSGGVGDDGPSANPGNQYTSKTNIITGEDTENDPPGSATHLVLADLTANLEAGVGNGIDPIYQYAWNDVVGWISFATTPGTVSINSDANMNGYANSQMGFLALDCATSPGGDICTSNATFGVYQTGNYSTGGATDGVLSGVAWNDGLGWVSFNCTSTNTCSSQPGGVDYRVKINSQGFFEGWAWSDIVGWISFNCDHSAAGDPLGINACPLARGGDGTAPNYAVKTGSATVSTGYLVSTILDTNRAGGVSVNTVNWLGSANGGAVKFQIATGNTVEEVSTSSFVGPDGSSNSYYSPVAPGIPRKINKANHPDAQYIRYKVRLESNAARTASPRIDDIVINYSL